MASFLIWEIVETFDETVIFIFILPKILMWLTLTTTTNNNKFISTVYRQLKEFTKNIIIKNSTNYTQEPMAIEYVRAFLLLTETPQDVCRTSMADLTD